jgi:xylan 1,4-beta-xylosidase
VKGAKDGGHAMISPLYSTHGSIDRAYAAIGKPINPTPRQITDLRRAAQIPQPQAVPFQKGKLALAVPSQGLALVEIH